MNSEDSHTSASLVWSAGKRRPWHPDWWVADLGPEQRASCVERIETNAAPGPSYYVLLLLSTLIAAYGLLSNSTATVIGAMIVAPLMGPILGLAMGTVLADVVMFRRSLVAEVSGVILVVLTAMLVAQATGVAQIDFSASEIANRTRPTLYDLAIGLAAGLAGSFCLVHPGLQSSVAGVAIAVALVPPLTVTGLTCAGWLQGQLSWRPAFGSFMLFLANFLTIELAAGLLFRFMGFRRQQSDNAQSFRRAIVVQLLLLLATGLFLSQQLAGLIRERVGLTLSRQTLRSSLQDIPGADLDSLRVELQRDTLLVRAVVGTRTELSPAQVAQMQGRLQSALAARLPEVRARLVVRSVSSTYASAEAFLFEPQDKPPSPEQVRSQLLETGLRRILSQYPGVELSGFQPLVGSAQGERLEPEGQREAGAAATDGPEAWPVEVTLRSPYTFGPRLVGELEERLGNELATVEPFQDKPVRLLVRTVAVSSATAAGQVRIAAPGDSSETARNEQLDALIMDRASRLLGQEILQVSSRPAEPDQGGRPPTGPAYVARVELQGPALLSVEQAERLRREVVEGYQDPAGLPLVLELEVDSRLARTLRVGERSSPSPPTPAPAASPESEKTPAAETTSGPEAET